MKKNVLHLSVLLCMLSAFGILTTNAQTTFGPQEIITTMADGANSVYACDIDGDGDNDVLSAAQHDSTIAWYENTDGNGAFGSQQIISKLATVAWSVYACDIDGDGDLDVLSADHEKVIWHENTDGNGNFSLGQIIADSLLGCYSVYACDIDGDGDNDVLSATFNNGKIAWYENTDGNGTFGAQQIIVYVHKATSVYACDIDDDGDNDVLVAAMVDNEISWYENIDGNGTFGDDQIITTSAGNVQWIYACDIDGDGDNDVLSACWDDGKIAWYENIDNGAFGEEQIIITNTAGGKLSVYACDLDNDGDNDVLSADYFWDRIAWYENTDGNGTFGPEQIITSLADYAESVYACDIDGDGDNDVLSASYADNKIAWYENLTITGIETLKQTGFSIFPNPTSGMLHLEFADNNIQKIVISDIAGKQLIEKSEIQQNETIDLSGFENGIYILSIQTDKEMFSTKIVKE